ncbi:hypothetical protein ACRBEV_31180 [Methylobacterium phyllosphaerae]
MIGHPDKSLWRSSDAAPRPAPALRLTNLVLAASLATVAATAPCRAEEGNIFTNLFKYGGTTVPPSQPESLDPPYCPPVEVAEGRPRRAPSRARRCAPSSLSVVSPANARGVRTVRSPSRRASRSTSCSGLRVRRAASMCR